MKSHKGSEADAISHLSEGVVQSDQVASLSGLTYVNNKTAMGIFWVTS